MRPLLPSCGLCRHRGASATLSHCNPISWPVNQLGCSYSLQPSCGLCCHHAAPAALMQHLFSCQLKLTKPGSPPTSYLFPAAPAAAQRSFHDVKPGILPASYLFMRPLPPSRGPSRHHAAPAALMWPLSPSCGPCCPHAAPASPAPPHEAWQSAGFLQVLYLFFCSLGPSSLAESRRG
jgi:hypothetical protein